jgi:hypothetical protein
VAAATIAAARIDAGHFEPISGPGSPTGQDSRAPAAPAQGKSIRIPIKLSGNGKPGHVLVNLAVDVEIVVDAEDR